jgi:hypothetical protein
MTPSRAEGLCYSCADAYKVALTSADFVGDIGSFQGVIGMAVREREHLIQDIEQLIGDPKQLDEELQDFRKQAKMFSSHRARFIDRYPKQWIAVSNGKVSARGRTLSAVMREIDAKGLPRGRTIVRYIDKNVRTFIL